MVLTGKPAYRLGEREVARAKIGNERQPADPHHVIGGDRRQYVIGVDLGKAGDRDRMRRMEMDDRAGGALFFVHDAMQKTLLGRRVARDEPPVMVEL